MVFCEESFLSNSSLPFFVSVFQKIVYSSPLLSLNPVVTKSNL